MTTKILEHRYAPRGAALAALNSRAPELLLSGPAGTGKSRAVLEKLHLLCLNNPGLRVLMVRQTLESLKTSAIVTYQRDVVPEALLDGSVTYYGGSVREPAQFRYDNGASIAMGGLDKPNKVMSTEWDVIYVQEAVEITEDAWLALSSRLRNGRLSYQQLIADCNPDHPTHWLKLRCEAGRTLMLHSRHEDNPRYFNADGSMTEQGSGYMARLDALTGVRRLRLRDGIWAAAEGVIYDGWDPAIHLVDRFTPPRDWDRIWSIDFGFVHPFVWQEWVIDGDGRMYLHREIYRTKRLVEDHAAQILALTENDPRPRAIVADHDAEDRATLERKLGLGIIPANKTVSEGIQAVASRLKVNATGKPRLMVMKDARIERDQDLADARQPTCTVEEVGGYIWLDKRVKEQPLKEKDDGCLVAGSLVTTSRGQVPIERVTTLDVVATRQGWCRVIASGMTDASAEVFELTTTTGVLRGTGNHPVWTDRGFVRLDALRYGDRLTPWLSWSYSTESGIAATPTRSTSRPGSRTFATARARSIAILGSRQTGRSRTVTTSTTSTAMRRTMISPISSFSPSRSIRRSTPPSVTPRAGTGRPRSLLTWSASGRSPRLGMQARKAGPGTASTVKKSGRGASLSSSPVITARRGSSRSSRPATGFAQTSANLRRAARPESTTWTGPVAGAVNRSRSTDTPRLGTVPVRVLSVRALPRREPVYNLTVRGCPEYFANGILVHNCDAMRYAVAELDLHGKTRVRWG